MDSRVASAANAHHEGARRFTALESYKLDRGGMTVKTTRTLVALAVVLGLAMLPATAVAQGGYRPVTEQRLVKPEPENWLQIRGNYQGWGYSPLGQITANNVKKLTPVWAFSTGVGSGHEAPPIVNNGVMFVATPYSQVIALEAKTGKLIWRYKRELPEDFKALHNTSRGIALFGDKVYVASLDCSLVALDAKTGKVAWEKKVEDYHTGYYMTLAPLVAKGKVMVGVSGGEFGVRGFVQAFDARSGAEIGSGSSPPPRTSSRTCSRASIRRPAVPTTMLTGFQGPASAPTSVRRSGAAKTGLRPPTTPRWDASSSRPTITTAGSWKAKCRSTWPGSGGRAWTSPISASPWTKARSTSARSRPGTSTRGSGRGVTSSPTR